MPAAPPTTVTPAVPTAESVGPRIIVSDILDIPVNDAASHELYRCQFTSKSASESRRTCGAQSFVRIVFAAGELYACGHHYLDNQTKLHESALEVHDQRGAINKKASVSATHV
jgi:hypothetical protein